MTVQRYLSGTSAVKIARSVEEAVASSRFTAGELLPSVRTLATQLSVSPATVASAYRLLQDRGVLVADGRRGTRVRPASPVAPALTVALPVGVQDLAGGSPDLALLPDLAAAARKAVFRQRLYDDELHDERLTRLATTQFLADGIPPSGIAVVSGALDGIERVLREHLRSGDRVVVEDPCFTGVLDLLNALGLTPLPVAIDDEGILPDELARALRSSPRALIVTPRAQNPTGAATSERRARQLRPLLRQRTGLLLIEDDHAGPIAGPSYVTLIEAGHEHWAVVRSVSKSLGPDLRVAVMAADPHTLARVEGRQILGSRWVSHVLQGIVAQLWSDKSVQKLLVRASRVYAQRREALITALRAQGIAATGASGLNVWVSVAEESATVQSLMQSGWAVTAGERYRIRSGPAIRVTTATLTPSDSVVFASDLAAVLRPVRRRTSA